MQDVDNGGRSPLVARLYGVFHLHDPDDPVARLLDRGVVAVVCCASLAAWFGTGAVAGSTAVRWMHGLDLLATGLLTLEYLVRVAVAGHGQNYRQGRRARLRYILSPMALFNFAAILPAWLSLIFPVNLGLSRLLRLVSVLQTFRPQWAEFRRLTQGQTARNRLYNLLFSPTGGGALHDLVERFMIWVVVVSVMIVTLETVPALLLQFHKQFASLDVMIGGVFLVEYLLRLYCVTADVRYASSLTGRLRYVVTPGALIDLVALLPLLFFFAGWDLTLLPVLRLFRMLKLVRHSAALALIVDVVHEERATLQATVFILVVLTTLAGTGVYFAEHVMQPDRFSSIPASMYWAVVTLTSIGYGDIYPVTVVGRVMTMVLAIASLGMVALPAGIVATAFSERLRQEAAKTRSAKSFDAGAPQEAVVGDPVERVAAIWRNLQPAERDLLRAMLDADAASRIGDKGKTG